MHHGPSEAEIEAGDPYGRIETAVMLLPTPRATDGTKGGPNERGSSGDLMLPSAVMLLPTPTVNDMGDGKTVDWWDDWTAEKKAQHGNGNGHGKSLAIEAQRLLPTPTAADAHASGGNSPSDVTLTDAVVRTDLGRKTNERH
jgi:DNA (cytosine-5)-methyltransferase 1